MLYGKITYSGGYYYFGGVSHHANIPANKDYDVTYDGHEDLGEIKFKVHVPGFDGGITMEKAHQLLTNEIGNHIRELQRAFSNPVRVAYPETIFPSNTDFAVMPTLRMF